MGNGGIRREREPAGRGGQAVDASDIALPKQPRRRWRLRQPREKLEETGAGRDPGGACFCGKLKVKVTVLATMRFVTVSPAEYGPALR